MAISPTWKHYCMFDSNYMVSKPWLVGQTVMVNRELNYAVPVHIKAKKRAHSFC